MSKSRFVDKDLITFYSDNNKINEHIKIWNSETVNTLLDGVENKGIDLDKSSHPFFDKNIKLRRGRINFQYTDNEIDEIRKCKKDVIYFANKYAKVMQEHGIDNINLYDYQKEMLMNYQNERYSLICGSRQVGKCNSLIVSVLTKKCKVLLYDIWYNSLIKKTIFDKLKYSLYKLYSLVHSI